MERQYTREELLKAQILWNRDHARNPDKFISEEEMDYNDPEMAERQIDYLLSLVG